MKKGSSAEPDRVAASEGAARQGGAFAASEAALSLRANAAAGKITPVSQTPKGAVGLWLWVAGAFLLLLIAWTVMFTVARSAKIQSVPRTTQGGR